MTTIKVEDEMTLEIALVSLLPDFEVEVSSKVDGSLLILATMIMITLANVRGALQSALRQRPPTGRWSSTGTCCSSRRCLSTKVYSVCSLVVPTLEEAILTSVLKKNFK